MKSGFVSLVGRPNSGKSTLLNSLIGRKVAITSDKPQTTRNQIQGIYNEEEIQIVFVDTPGIHKPNHKLGKYLNRQAYYSIDDVDVVVLVVDASVPYGKGDEYVLEKLKETDKPVILVLNKIDKMKFEEMLPIINFYKDLYPFREIIPASALKQNNTDTLIKVLKNYLPDQIRYYAEGDFTNKSIQFIIGEIVREKVFNLTDEEVPHSVTCIVEAMEKNKDSYNINVAVIVDRDALKKIIIGKQGSMVKQIGISSRVEIEKLLDSKVYLELYVKTIKKWRDKEKHLHDLGFDEF